MDAIKNFVFGIYAKAHDWVIAMMINYELKMFEKYMNALEKKYQVEAQLSGDQDIERLSL